MKQLPVKHISARVPWHDQKWSGSVCKNVMDNSFCRILPNVAEHQEVETESKCSGQFIHELQPGNYPPCLGEKGTFMSKHEFTRQLEHAYKRNGNLLFKDFLPATFHHKPYSFNAIPFLWMSKDRQTHASEMANLYELEYDEQKEQSVQLGFDPAWVQHPDNQKALLNGFFGCLQPKQSLVFFYCNDTPLSEPKERVIVGVAQVSYVGDLVEYRYPDCYQGHKSYVWDRCIGHTLRDDHENGFLMPYHEILDYKNKSDEEIVLRDYVAFAPEYKQFSYSSELVSHDTAIESLLQMAAALKKASTILNNDYSTELLWIDERIAEIWDMRGAFPGMGPVLAALQFENANSIAWLIEKHILNKEGDLLHTNPWDIFEVEIVEPGKILGSQGQQMVTATNKKIWKLVPPKKKAFYKLLSRCQLNNAQANLVVKNGEEKIGTIEEMTENMYLLYEKTRFEEDTLSFQQIDKAIFPSVKVQEAIPIPDSSRMEDALDERRVRALLVYLLEEAAAEGHSLLPDSDLLERIEMLQLDPACPLNKDSLEIFSEIDSIKEEIQVIPMTKTNTTTFYKLQRLAEIKRTILNRLSIERAKGQFYEIHHDWEKLVISKIFKGELPSTTTEKEKLSITEKAHALRILCNYRFSVLIGPAGSGKTTLLDILCNIPEIQQGGVLKLAPTGKARVKLGNDAKTLAQFLLPERYDLKTGIYRMNANAPKYSGAQTVIVDEASMLTEEQLAALIDKLGSVQRIILVGDYRQLPPIGTGRPFVDIVSQLKAKQFDDPRLRMSPAYAELVQIHRQSKNGSESIERQDVRLSRCFGDEIQKVDMDFVNLLAHSSSTDYGDHLELIKWYDIKELREKLQQILKTELSLKDGREGKDFNLSIGGTEVGNYIYFNKNHAEKFLEEWQILSPVNGYGFGVREVNKFIQSTYRRNFVNLALNVNGDGKPLRSKLKVAKPKGTDNIVYGDKVMNLRNTTWANYQRINPMSKRSLAMNYIANGEIGVITGEFRSNNDTSRGEPNVEITFSTQPGYSYVFNPSDLGEEGRYPFELAYCISVHKSQGSGFKKAILILPSGSSLMSREMLYTAMTRQVDRLIILHQGEFRDFLKYSSDQYSDTARRFTDLFGLPVIRQVRNKRFDSRYINISERGESMISKNEVIIANSLYKYEKEGLLIYSYEDKLHLKGGVVLTPDFKVEHLSSGRVYYWEHLGMMSKESYRNKWALKYQAYLDNGFVPLSEASRDEKKVLILTEENPSGGIDSQYFDRIIRTVILGYDE